MTVSLKTQIQSRGQYGLHAKCRYCGNAWFPFGEKTLNPPVDAVVKCSKCKSKQHIHWIGGAASIPASTGQAIFPSLKSVDFEHKKAMLPKIESPESSTPIAPQIKQNTADIAPLPELKEKSEPKQDIRPIFKARMIQPVTGKNELRPVFKASTRLQSRPITKSEPLVQPKPEIKPAAPAPVREIKIEDEPPSAPIVEVKVVQPEVQVKIIQPEVKPLESKPFEIHEVELHEAKVPRAEPELEHEQKPVLRAASPEPEASRGPEIQPEAIPKVEIGTQIKESEVNAPQSKPEPRSMFKKSQSLFKSEISASPSPLFKSKIKRDLKHESRPPVDIPETRAEPEPNEKPVLEAEPEKEIRPERHPARSRTRRELFPPRKSEVEVRESPLEDEPELEKVPEPEPKPDLPSGLPARKKTRRKLSEVPGELEDSEV